MIDACVRKRGQVHVRGYATRIAATSRFVYVCPEGHTHTADLNAGKRGKRFPVGEAGLQLYARYWSKEAGGVSFMCPKCTKLYRSDK